MLSINFSQLLFNFLVCLCLHFKIRSPASSVKLEDKNFPADKFEYLSGFDQVKWARIPASSNVSHTAVLKPKIVGPYNFTSAVVSYLPSDKNSKTQVCFLNI